MNQEYVDIMCRANLIAREVYNNREKYPDDMWHLARAFAMLAKEELATLRSESAEADWSKCAYCKGKGFIEFTEAPSTTSVGGKVTQRQCLHNGTYVDGSLVMALPGA